MWVGLAIGGSLAFGMLVLGRRIAARLVVTPFRHRFYLGDRARAVPFEFRSGDCLLRGWRFRPHGEPVGLVVFLHGHSDNRHLSAVAAEHLVPMGFEVLAYDSRAHGESGGAFCTFGVREKEDLSCALDAAGADQAIVIGTSLGASVALLAAADDERIRAVVAHAPFVDMREAIADRTGVLPRAVTARAIADAERIAGFCSADAAPLAAAPRIRAPVLLVHGTRDRWTPPTHSTRILDALGSDEKRILWVEGAGHADAIEGEQVWVDIASWIQARHRAARRPRDQVPLNQ